MVAQLQAAFNAQQAQRDQEIANLVAAISQRDAQTEKQKQHIQQVTTVPEAVQAVQSLYTLPDPLKITATGAEASTEDLKLFSFAKLDANTAQSDLKDTQDELKEEQASFAQLAGVNTGLQTRIDGLNTVITTNNNQCEADKKTLKDAARKSKWHLFWWGYGAGFVSDEIFHRLLGK